jgi:hypothetical protein
MIMTAVAKAVHRGNGSVHYLSSSVDGSLLIVTDPALGIRRIPVEGPCRLIAGHPSGAARYEAISATCSTTIDVQVGEGPSLYQGGACVFLFSRRQEAERLSIQKAGDLNFSCQPRSVFLRLTS